MVLGCQVIDKNQTLPNKCSVKIHEALKKLRIGRNLCLSIKQFVTLKTMHGRFLSILITFFCFWLDAAAQNYGIGHTSITFLDASRGNRSIACEIYYPATTAGDNVPVVSGKRFPCVSFGHGFVMAWDAYKNVWNAIVPQGFIMIFPKTEGSTAPSHSEFGNDLSFVISAMEAQSKLSSSLFFERIDSIHGVMGHSMGGGAAFLAAEKSNKIKFLATLAPADTKPSAIAAASKLSIPTLIIAGGNDCVTPPKDHQIPMFDSLRSACKTLVSINGGSHCQMAEDNFLCNFGEATCSPKATISRSEQHQIQFQFIVPWLKYHLLKDQTSGKTFDSVSNKSTVVNIRKNCVLTVTSRSTQPNIEIPILHPLPVSNTLYVGLQNPSAVNEIMLTTLDGRILHRWNQFEFNERGIILQLPDNISTGLYFLNLTTSIGRIECKLIKE